MKYDIEKWVRDKDWLTLVQKGLPVTIADSYSYEEAMHIVAELSIEASKCSGDFEAIRIRDFAITVLCILRAMYPERWQEDWQNEAYLGILCGTNLRDDEAFQYLHNAFESVEDPPAALILPYVSSGSCPPYRLSDEKILHLTQQAAGKEVTVETAQTMAYITDDDGWKYKAEEAEKADIHTEYVTPEAMKSVFEQAKK